MAAWKSSLRSDIQRGPKDHHDRGYKFKRISTASSRPYFATAITHRRSAPYPLHSRTMPQFENKSLNHTAYPVVQIPSPFTTASGEDGGHRESRAGEATDPGVIPNRRDSKTLFGFTKQVTQRVTRTVGSCLRRLYRGLGREDAALLPVFKKSRARNLPTPLMPPASISHTVQSVVAVPPIQDPR